MSKELAVHVSKKYNNVFEKNQPVIQKNTVAFINTLEVVRSDYFDSFEQDYITGNIKLGEEITFYVSVSETWYTGKIVYILSE